MQTDSPFKHLRQLTGLNVPEFAAVADISRQSILNVEAGMYVTTPIRANRALANRCKDYSIDASGILFREYGENKLDTAMESWKREKRRQLNMRDWQRMTLNDIVDRFESPGAFCRQMCIPTAALYNVTVRHTAVPQVIKQALHDAGYRYDDWTVQ